MIDSLIDLILGLFLGIIIGCYIIIYFSEPDKAIVRHGCAQYNNITGDFEWIKKEEK